MSLNKIVNMYLDSWLGSLINPIGYSLHKFSKDLAKKMKQAQSVLDVGAGTCPYKKYFKHCKYTSQDFCAENYGLNYSHIDIKSEIYNIPVEDNSFDYVLCTQVLEHLYRPDVALTELYRILKKGGELWLTCPGFWEEHDVPNDFFRYTRYSLEQLACDTGFEVEYIVPQVGRFVTFGKVLKDLIPGMTKSPKIYMLLFLVQLPVVFPVLLLMRVLDTFDKRRELTLNYEAVFKKI